MTRLILCVTGLFFTLLSSAHAVLVPANVSSQWLIEHLKQPGLAIIEMSDEVDYSFNGHIPGSVVTNKSNWRYAAEDGALIHYAPSILEKKIQQLGINHDDGIVIYYKGNTTDEVLGAVYLFWLFHLLGHTNVGLLDEGWHGWLKADGPIATDSKPVSRGNFTAHPLLALEIGTRELHRIYRNYMLVDGRPASHFAGLAKFDANPRYGRIAQSLSQPWQDYMRKGKDGRVYAKAPAMPALLKKHRPDPAAPILLTCFGGTGAAFNYVMFYIAGYRNLRVDDAAMRRWNALDLPLIKTNVHKTP